MNGLKNYFLYVFLYLLFLQHNSMMGQKAIGARAKQRRSHSFSDIRQIQTAIATNRADSPQKI